MRFLPTRQAMRLLVNAARNSHIRADGMSDHMLRDIGFIDSPSPLSHGGLCEADAPLRSLDRFAITRHTS